MTVLVIVVVGAVVVAIRLALRRRRRGRVEGAADRPAERLAHDDAHDAGTVLGGVGLVAGREIRERLNGRIFRVGTAVMLLGIGAVIVIPTLHKSGGPTVQRVGTVGTFSAEDRLVVQAAARANGDRVEIFAEPSAASARTRLRSGAIDLAILDGSAIVVDQPTSSSTSPADAGLVEDVAEYLGVLRADKRAGLTQTQMAAVNHAKPIAVRSLVPGTKTVVQATSIIGLVLLFFMLSQYCTWILIGVMQEKSSRVVEVLLATLRPLQLLGGKVLGIGAVALGQAALLLGFALALGAAVGTDFLHGAVPTALLAEFVWLILGYAFYCWVYAAAGSMAERQDQVQTLALPLSLPVLFGYVYSITVASTGHPGLLCKVLAYVPLTAPFCMSVLVSLHQVSWLQFVASALLSIAATVGVARLAAQIYRRAVLRTGARVHLRELVTLPRRARGAPSTTD